MNIIDAFVYSNEFELLKLRIQYLKSSTDFFCAVVGSHFFTGKRKVNDFSKELKFAHSHGVHLHIIEIDFHRNIKWQIYSNLWKRRLPKCSEDLQRKHGCQSLKSIYNKNDFIFFSDVDEIPSRNFVQEVKTGVRTFEHPVRLKMYNFYYHNKLLENKRWVGSFASRIRDINHNLLRSSEPQITSTEEGWHLSYMGGKNNIKQKLMTFGHQEYTKPALAHFDETRKRIQDGKDLFNRSSEFSLIKTFDEVYDDEIIKLFSETDYFSES